MGKAKELGVNEALRKAGFVPLPRWWVKREDLEVIHAMAHKHEEAVTRIRREVRTAAELKGQDDE